jgi:hypothetical protein
VSVLAVQLEAILSVLEQGAKLYQHLRSHDYVTIAAIQVSADNSKTYPLDQSSFLSLDSLNFARHYLYRIGEARNLVILQLEGSTSATAYPQLLKEMLHRNCKVCNHNFFQQSKCD